MDDGPPMDLPRLIPPPLSPERPCLLFTPERVAEMRRMRETYAWARHAGLDALLSAERIGRPTPAGGGDDWVVPPMPVTDRGRGRQNFMSAFHATMIGYLDEDEGYLRRAWETLRYALENESHIWWQPASLRVACAADGLQPHLTDAERERLAELLRDAFRRGPDFSKSHNNIGAGHRKAQLGLGVVLSDAALIEEALNDPDTGAVRLLRDLVLDDGIWAEMSVGYQSYGMLQFAEIAWLCERIGLDFKSLFDARLRLGCEALFGLMDAQCELPAVGDSARGGLDGQAASPLMELVVALYGSATAGWATRRTSRSEADVLAFGVATPPSEAPQADSALFPVGGFAALRAGDLDDFWGSDGLTAFLFFGDHGGWHGHLDALQLELRAFGAEMVTARRRAHAYKNRTHSRWHQTTLAHSTVVVDAEPQTTERGPGECLSFHSSPMASAACTRHPGAYPGVEYERAIVLTDRYLIDSFRVASESTRLFHYVLHGEGIYTSEEPMERIEGLGRENGYEFLSDLRARDVDGPWEATLLQGGHKGDEKAWQPAGTGMGVRSLNDLTGRLLFVGCWDGATLGVEDCLIAETRGPTAHFLTLLEPYRDEPALASAASHGERRDLCVEVRFADTRDVVCYAPDGPARFTVGEIEFDGAFLLARLGADGSPLNVTAREARLLRIGGEVLLDDEEGGDLGAPVRL